MRRSLLALTAIGVMTVGSLAACNSGDDTGTGATKTPKIGVILPDSKSSNRWETADHKYLEDAFKAAGVKYDIQNAQGDKSAFQTIADQMITNGATVLLTVNLDSGTGKAVIDKARSQGVATIDYDRLTLGGNASYYVSFDNEAVGKLQGQGLVDCLTKKNVKNPVIAELNGSPTDNNATLFKNGYDSVLKPKYDAKEYTKGPDQSVPDWDNAQGGVIFEQMLTTAKGKIDGVLAANDGLGNAAIAILKKNKLNGKVPVTGQDATVQGLQNILLGDQCMTVYKAIKKEADEASALAILLAKGEKKDTGQSVTDPTTQQKVPAVLLTPVSITIDNVKDVVTDGFVKKEELCAGDFAAKCTAAGIS